MSDFLAHLYDTARRLATGPVVLAAFLLTGLWFTLLSGGFQITRVHTWLGSTLATLFPRRGRAAESKPGGKGFSQLQAMSTVLAATVGTGNIVGVASALALGGPGAVFWMWISAFLGMMTGFAENVLGLRYRYKGADGSWVGGAMVYMERGLRSRPLACAYALFCTLAALGMGNMTQSNSIALAMRSFSVPAAVTGAVCAVLVGLALFGGIKRIGAVAERLVPPMVVLYTLGALACLALRAEALPGAVTQIFREAFSLRSAAGGAAGYGIAAALRMGVSRGVFSNEAGLGSSVLAHTATDVKNPAEAGLWAMFEVFVDTLVMCTLTALVILTSGVYDAEYYAQNLLAGLPVTEGAELTARAMEASLGPLGAGFVSVALAAFGFATLLGWSYYGERSWCYLFGQRGLTIYRMLFVALVAAGAVSSIQLVWDLSDIANALMALPNLAAILLLSGQVRKSLRELPPRL